MPNHLAGDAATDVSGSSSRRFELDPAAPWGGVDFRAMDWTPYGIADFDQLDDDRKLLLCMAAYYTDFDFDPLFKRGDRMAAVDGLDLKDAVKLVQPLDERLLRGAVLRREALEGGWAPCFKRVLDRIEGRCGMTLRIPCIPLNSGINDALCYAHGEGRWLWYEEDAEVFSMLAERGASFRIPWEFSATSPSPVYDDDSKLRAFFHLPGEVRRIFLESRKWSLDGLDFEKVSVRKELLASWNADAYRWLRDHVPDALRTIKPKDVEGTLLSDAFYEGKSRPRAKSADRACVGAIRKWDAKTAKAFASTVREHDFDAADEALRSVGAGFPGGKWDIELWVDCAKKLDREAFDYLLSRGFDFPTAVGRIELPEKHPVKLEGCFVTDVMAPLKSYYEKQRKLHYDSVSGKWDEVAEGVKGDARYMLETLCDLGCKMPDVNRLTCMQEKLKDRRGFGPKLYFFGLGFSYVVAQWPRDVELLRKVRASGFPVGGTAEQGIALEFALRGGGAPSARALVEMGFKMPAKHWFQFSIVSQKALTSQEFQEAYDYAREQGWDVR